MKTVTERQLEVATEAIRLMANRVGAGYKAYDFATEALAEIERIGKEGEVDAAIEKLETGLHFLGAGGSVLREWQTEIESLIAEVRRLRAEEVLTSKNVEVCEHCSIHYVKGRDHKCGYSSLLRAEAKDEHSE